MNKITGEVTLKTDHGNIIRRARYNTTQVAPVIRNGDTESYNLEGATDYIKGQKALWEASDQFIGRNLVVEVS